MFQKVYLIFISVFLKVYPVHISVRESAFLKSVKKCFVRVYSIKVYSEHIFGRVSIPKSILDKSIVDSHIYPGVTVPKSILH